MSMKINIKTCIGFKKRIVVVTEEKEEILDEKEAKEYIKSLKNQILKIEKFFKDN